jgi:polysaccharide biosynthesis/export protein
MVSPSFIFRRIKDVFWCMMSFLLFSSLKAQDENTILKPNDQVSLTVFQENDLTTLTKIQKSNEASFPLIGIVKIGGHTLKEATEIIRDLYAKDYLVSPQVNLTVVQYAVENVSVLGAVKSPGQIQMPPNGKLDLSTALGSAGGLAENADKQKISLVKNDGNERTYRLADIQAGAQIPLSPGDRVIVYESAYVKKTATILGQVKKPGAIEFPLEGGLDLLTGIAMAGGFTDLANPKKVTVNRRGVITSLDAKSMSEQGSKTYQLLPGDIVTVMERWY